MRVRSLVCSIALLAAVLLGACDSGSGDEQVFREPGQNIPPTAIFTSSITQGKIPLLNVQFDATQSSDSNGTINNYAWDFGDGTSVSGPDQATAVHSFVDAGSFSVTLTVTDNDNANSNVASQVITVLPNQPPLANFTSAVEQDGLTATFDAALSSDSDGTILLYAWDFAGLDVASGSFATYAFPVQGDYDVTLTITDDNGDTDTIIQGINLPGPNLPPTASVETVPAADPTSGSVIGISRVSVMFDAAASSDADGTLARYDWSFGDATFGTASVDPGTGDIDPNSVAGVSDGVNDGDGITAYHIYSTLSSSLAARSVPGSLTRSMAVGDIDNDDDIDFVAGNFAEANHLFLNNGNTAAPFEDVRSIDIANEVGATNAVALDYLNNDNFLDLIVVNGVIDDPAGPAGAANRVYLWDNALGEFASGADVASGDINVSTSLAVGDVNRDSNPDLVVGNLGAPARVYLGNVLGGFDSGVDASESLAGASVVLGDLDGDNNLDLVIGIVSGPNRLYPGDGSGGFLAGFDISTDSYNTVSLALADVDGDSDLDLVAGNLGARSGEPNRLYLNSCDNVCAAGSNVFAGVSGSDITTDSDRTSVVEFADIDGDGDQDLLVGNVTGLSRLYLNHSNLGPDLLFNTTLAGVDCDTTPNDCNEVPVLSGSEFSNEKIGSLQLVDFDAAPDSDVDPQLLVGTLGDATKLFASLCNNGCDADTNPYAGATAVSIPTNNTTAVTIGDVNNDGAVDLIVGQLGDVNRLHLSSDGVSFALGSDISADIEATYAVVLGDVDNDGDLDLIVGNGGDGNRVYPNVCDGTCSINDPIFGPAINIGLDLTNTADLALGDIDQDGDLDLVAGNGIFGAQPNRVYINFCDAGCPANSNVYPGVVGIDILPDIASTNSIALGDLDGDGDLDLVAGDDATPSRVYANSCDGLCPPNTSNFDVVGSVALDTGSVTSVVLGDLDNDADLDLVIGYADRADRIFLNNTASPAAAISFMPGTDFGNAADITSDVGLADINGDGFLDIVAAVDGVSQLYLNDGSGQFGPRTAVTGEPLSVRSIAVANVDDPMLDRDIDVVFGAVGAPNRLHSNAGAHIALLTVTDDDDGTDSIPIPIAVLNNQPPQALFSVDTSGGMTVLFDASASDDLDPRSATPPNNGIEMFSWDFGDGQSVGGPNAAIVSNSYATPGRYAVRLTVMDDGGVVSTVSAASDDITRIVEVVNNPPIAAFSATPESGPAPLLVTFDASASTDTDGTIIQYGWDFGDGQFDTGISPTHTFDNAGVFDVSLTVTDNIGDTAILTQSITVN